MKKIISIGAVLFALAAMPAWAQTTTTGNTTGTGTPVSTQTQTVDVACLGIAADTLTASLSSATDTFSASIKAAYQTRLTGWKAAWTLDKKARAKAIIVADQKFRTDAKSANKTLTQVRKAAWDKIKADRKACRGGANVPMPEVRSE